MSGSSFNTFETNPHIASSLANDFLNEMNLPNHRILNQLNSTTGFRREGSLDRADFDTHAKRAIFNPFLQSYAQQQQQIPNCPIYANSTLYLNGTPTTTQPTTPSLRRTNHRRSNSILSANSFQTNSNANTLGRDFMLNSNGLRSALRASSVTNIQRDPSCNSVKSLNVNNGSNMQQHQQHQSSSDTNQSRLNFIRDLQIRFMDVQKECYYLNLSPLNACVTVVMTITNFKFASASQARSGCSSLSASDAYSSYSDGHSSSSRIARLEGFVFQSSLKAAILVGI
jgi:hypothetical protein